MIKKIRMAIWAYRNAENLEHMKRHLEMEAVRTRSNGKLVRAARIAERYSKMLSTLAA